MKKYLALVFYVCVFACQAQTVEKSLDLDVPWKFILGDNPSFASPNCDDSQWKNIAVDKIWEASGYDPYDGYAWYRIKIVIPTSLKNEAGLKDSLLIYLGKINNFDQTFLNGELIGINGRNVTSQMASDTNFIHAPTNFWDKKRPYTLAVNDPRIRWDQENLISVRVFDQGGQGGLYTGDQAILMTKLTDYLVVENNLAPYIFNAGSVKKKVGLHNSSSSYHITGEFKIEALNKLTGKEIYHQNSKISLAPGERREFDIKIGQLSQSAIITYLCLLEKSNDKLTVTDETPYITTLSPPDSPRINGALVTAARPGNPFLFNIPVTGIRPMQFDVEGLPPGLTLDRKTGIITGKVDKKSEYPVILKAKNAKGEDSRQLTISIGDKLCLTPPMGWNSWNCWGIAVDEQKVLTSARKYRDKGLMNHGWSYVNIDDGWEIYRDKEPKRDLQGNILTNEKFPHMKRLGDSIHALGLKFGIYSSPGPLTCGGYTASYQHEEQDARSYSSWGIDYLKYDWCSYDGIARDTSLVERKKPYFVMRDALGKVGRDIVYSLCQYGMSKVWEWGNEVGGNLWRTTGDITDTWESLREIGFSQIENQPFAKPGNWNDPDMLIVGWVGWGPNLHPTRLTPDEQYTHISLWCLLSAPLLIGCDLERLDEFTLSLLTNDDVIAIDQDPLGSQAKRIKVDGDIQVWIKELADGGKAFGVFNLGSKTQNYKLDFVMSGCKTGGELRDLWRQTSLGKAGSVADLVIPSHGVMLLKLK